MNSTDPSSYMAQQCSPGYHGPLCSLCTTDGPRRYGRTGTLQCQPCRPSALIVLVYIASSVLVLLYLTYNIHVTVKENEEAVAGRGEEEVQASELLRVTPVSATPIAVAAAFCMSVFAPPRLLAVTFCMLQWQNHLQLVLFEVKRAWVCK